jgi:site-specific DNA-methyltransferase (adenine-specific)
MQPYYQDSAVTIYHGDCREVLPMLDGVDLILTDPPYGINHPTDYAARGRGNRARTHDFKPVFGDDAEFNPTALLSIAPCVLWGANYYVDKLPTGNWLVWDKRVREGVGVNDQADGELAWTNAVKGVRIFRHMWNGMWRDSERGESYHPMQKPAALMRWCLSKAGKPPLIGDPYCGSGPVLRAAKDLGLRAIGIEIEEQYCEIAASRMAQEVLAFGNEVESDVELTA